MGVVRALFVPPGLEIPIILEYPADELILVRQERQKVRLEHGIPYPLPVEIVPRAGLQPAMLQRSLRGPDLIKDALAEDIVREENKTRIF